MKSWFGKLIPVVFFCAFLFTTFSLFTIYANVSTLQASEKMVGHTRIVENAINKLYALLTAAENQQRNYLITDQQKFLDTFTSFLPQISQQLQLLTTLTQDDQTQQTAIKQLNILIPERIAYLHDGITSHQQEASSSQISSIGGKGSQTMETIKTILQSMTNQEEKLLNAREEKTRNEYKIIYANSFFTFLGDTFIIILVFYFLRKELQQRSEIEQTKDDFINLASHELNTPITSLKIFSKVLRNKVTSGKSFDAKRYIDKIDEQTNKLTMLITDLLDISRIQTGKISINKEKFPLVSLINETVEGIQGTTRIHTITTKQHYQKDVFADRYRIYQVLVNLLTNAIKYSPKGGNITITSNKKGREVVVAVADQGIGIDKKFQKKIFERLYQVPETKEKTFPGLGIGLFISREIIDLHGGRMWVESDKGKGSIFIFTIPI